VIYLFLDAIALWVRIANKVSSPLVPVALGVTEDGNIPGMVLIAGAAEFPAVSPAVALVRSDNASTITIPAPKMVRSSSG
jgi:hypothetical protein